VKSPISEGGTFSDKNIFDDSNLADQAHVDLIAGKISEAMRQTFLETDKRLLNMCREKRLHYASSTGVVAVLWRNLLTIAHVGDSKACIVRESAGSLLPEWLTEDHKPNMPNELARIEESGGSLAWLHGNKPYIRGGDFTRRQQNGEHPKQLNYSRAFGGKDLKCFGLIADPDVSQFYINPDDKLILIASDGLWDVLNPRVACDIAMRAKAEGRSATQSLVHWAIQEMPHVGVRDNVTVLALFDNDNDIVNDAGAVPLGVTMDIASSSAAATVAKTTGTTIPTNGVKQAKNDGKSQQSWSNANVPLL
jgi:protein phosphatase